MRALRALALTLPRGGATMTTVPTDRFHTVIAESYASRAIEHLASVGRVTALEAADPATLQRALIDADALLVRTYTRVDGGVLDAAPRLRVIGRGGVGLDNIDLVEARRRGVVVVYTPAAGTQAVADLTVGLLIALVRRLREADLCVRAGRFHEGRAAPPAAELSALTLGIVGLGRIGGAVARRCRAGFGMPVLFNDVADVVVPDAALTRLEKEELFARSDVVSLHVPLTDLTHRMINAESLAWFRRGALLINTSRGAVVDCVALADALRSGQVGGAALDVFDPEPLPPDHPLLHAPNTLFTPHVGARTTASLDAMNDVVEDVIRVLRGEAPRFPAW
jgi:D-3-phosphoglycerate dehydrogenase